MSLVVDLHHHVIPSFYWEAANEGGNAAGAPPRLLDYPVDTSRAIAKLRQLKNTAGLDDGDRHAVVGGSAARLIPALAQAAR